MIKSMNIAWWVKRWSELHPHKTAVIFEESHISYLELHQKVVMFENLTLWRSHPKDQFFRTAAGPGRVQDQRDAALTARLRKIQVANGEVWAIGQRGP